MKSACDEFFRTGRASKKALSNKSVTWWTGELDNYAEKGKRAKTDVPKDEKQRRNEKTEQNTISGRESKVCSNN